MKKYLFLLLIPLCMGFVACGSDDESINSKQGEETIKEISPLIGTWERVERESGSYRGYTWRSTNTYTYTFKNDGTYERIDVNEWTSEDEREADGSNTTYQKGNYAYDSTTRTLSIVPEDDRALSFLILTLTDKVLTFMWEDGDKWTFSKKS